jgi:Secretion system C-terminal sorting domain
VPAVRHHQNIQLYPNPASTKFSIPADDKITSLTIAGAKGHLLINKEINSRNSELDISGLLPEIYLLRIDNTEVRKFLKLWFIKNACSSDRFTVQKNT